MELDDPRRKNLGANRDKARETLRETLREASVSPGREHSLNDETKARHAGEAALAEAVAAAEKAAEAARVAEAAANRINRRLPTPAPVKIVTGAPPARGVPRKFNLERQRQYFDALARGTSKNDAAKLAGVTRQTLKNYRDKDADFAAAEEEAISLATELIEEALFDAARGGNIEAIKVWLYNRAPGRWTPPQKMVLEVTGQVDHIHDLPSALADIQQLEAALRARVLRNAETPALEAGVADAEVVED